MESISIFDIIKIGIGPSSSHTMGPWTASLMFLEELKEVIYNGSLKKIKVYLYGSLAKTGIGHGSDIAVLMGLSGENYNTIDTNTILYKVNKIKEESCIYINNSLKLDFVYKYDIILEFEKSLPFHPNGMMFVASLNNGTVIQKKYYSLGGGFVVSEENKIYKLNDVTIPYNCENAQNVIKYCKKLGISISEMVYKNEQSWRSEEEIKVKGLEIWSEIKNSVFRGIQKEGVLDGGLNVKRRAFGINSSLLKGKKFETIDSWINAVKNGDKSFTTINKWISCFALAVNEENASFGRIITAPTNGASGIIPAVLLYAYCFENFNEEQILKFLLTAGQIGILFKKNATISAAMGGCQAEVGVSSSMAAASLVECRGTCTPEQVLIAAEIAMEHHLGLTCDPVKGLVQIPCIERNTMGAIKAVTAANIAMETNYKDAKVSLDNVIASMWDTAKNMNQKYKETSEGGLALYTSVPVNVTEC